MLRMFHEKEGAYCRKTANLTVGVAALKWGETFHFREFGQNRDSSGKLCGSPSGTGSHAVDGEYK
jgi:hypothetical protein